jgi:uncharacterized membrane protein YbhN (UPF0104 family)
MRWVRISFAIATVVFLVIALVTQWRRIGPKLADITAPTLALSMAAVLAGLVATMFAWRALLADLGSRPRFTTTWQIFFAGQLGKYIPGSVWPVLIQMELAAEHSIPRNRSAAASIVQMGLTVGTGAMISVAALPFLYGHASIALLWIVVVIVLTAFVLHPRVANPILNYGLRVMHRAPLEHPLSWRGLLLATAGQSVAWLLFAMPVYLVGRDLGDDTRRYLLLSIGAFAVAWVAGFIFVLAPAGAGVRETLLVTLLSSSQLSAGSALAVALISRLLMTVGDAIVGGIALGAIGRRRLADARQREDSGGTPATVDSRPPG